MKANRVPLAGCEFCYLATLMDRLSRRLVGWHLAECMTEDLVIPVLRAGIRERQPAPGLIQHTDRGGQYASPRYRAILRRAGIRQSMSRADNCYDNTFMESGFGTLQMELEMTEYQHQRVAHREISDYIAYDNLERKHSALGDLSPHQFKRQHAHQKQAAGLSVKPTVPQSVNGGVVSAIGASTSNRSPHSHAKTCR